MAAVAAQRRGVSRKILAGLSSCALFATLWLLFAPPQLGGSTSYLVVYGASMAPSYEKGDLVLVRKARSYAVGDVAAYNSPFLGRQVLHRIVARDGDTFRFKGDNNSYVDSAPLPESALIGKHWFSIPGAGDAMAWVRTPRNAAILTALTTLLLFGGGVGGSRRGRRRAASAIRVSGYLRPGASRTSGGAALALAGIAGAGLLLSFVARQMPTTRTVSTTGAYTQEGRFSYSGAAAASPAYPSARVKTGQPAFTRLVDALDVRFDYRFSAKEAHAIRGTTELVAVVDGDSGWRRTMTLAPRRAFSGSAATAAGVLDLRALISLTDRFEQATGVASDSYGVTIRPRVTIEGTVGGREFTDRLGASLPMRLTPTALALDVASTPGGSGPGFVVSKTGSGRRVEAATMAVPVLGVGVRVETARTHGFRLGIAAGVLALLAALAAFLARGRTPEARIDARFGAFLVDVEPVRNGSQAVVGVSSIDALGRLAEHYERMILRERHADGSHSYVVEQDGVLYRYPPLGSSIDEIAFFDEPQELGWPEVERRDPSSPGTRLRGEQSPSGAGEAQGFLDRLKRTGAGSR